MMMRFHTGLGVGHVHAVVEHSEVVDEQADTSSQSEPDEGEDDAGAPLEFDTDEDEGSNASHADEIDGDGSDTSGMDDEERLAMDDMYGHTSRSSMMAYG
jgi:hypothetical protein